MILTNDRIEELRRLEHAGYVGGTRTKIADVLDTIDALQAEIASGCKCVCHEYPEHMRMQDALEALKWHQEQLVKAQAERDNWKDISGQAHDAYEELKAELASIQSASAETALRQAADRVALMIAHSPTCALYIDEDCNCSAADVTRAILALIPTRDSGEAAGEAVAKCPDALTPDGPVCPRCGKERAASGVDGGSWVHYDRSKARVTSYRNGVKVEDRLLYPPRPNSGEKED